MAIAGGRVRMQPETLRVIAEGRASKGDVLGMAQVMEALTAVMVADLTVYDMVKAIDRGMVIYEVRLLHKSGGASGDWNVSESASPDRDV